MGRGRFGLLVAPWLVAAVVLALAVPPPAGAQQPETTTLRVASTQSVDSFNPFLAVFASSTELGRLMYEFLTAYDPRTQQPVPALAESWTVSPDRLTWTFTIRSGAQWSDGRPITARDVAFTYDLMLRDADARTANGNFVATFASVTTPDARTVVIRTKTPQATMLALDIPIVPRHVWERVPSIGDHRNDELPVVGSGPFVLTGYVPEQFVTLRANDRYWRGRPAVDEVQFVLFTNTDAAVQALRRGEVDLIGAGSTSGGMTPAQFEALADDPGVTRNRATGRRYIELLMNPGAATREGIPIGDGHPALVDVRVRQAIDRGIDRDALVRRLLDGYGQRGASIVPPVYPRYHWSPAGPAVRRFDPGAANRMLDAAGYPRGPDGVRAGPDGQALRFRLIGRGERAEDARVGQFVRGWLADLDPGRRAGLVEQMQQRLHDQAPAVVLFYKNALEAYRSDRFAPFQVQPDPGGVITGQNGYWGFYSARPLAARDDADGTAIGVGAAALVVLGGLTAVLLIRRRRAGADERE